MNDTQHSGEATFEKRFSTRVAVIDEHGCPQKENNTYYHSGTGSGIPVIVNGLHRYTEGLMKMTCRGAGYSVWSTASALPTTTRPRMQDSRQTRLAQQALGLYND